LALAKGLNATPGVWALAADTDGIDGSSSAAGARVGPHTLSKAKALGLNVNEHATRHDSHGFFSALSDLVVTGPTLTNVNDFRAILIV
jgi:hydroxypyruvate reductase